MNKFKRAVMWVGLALIILLLLVSVYGAFIGAERAQSFINRLPLMVYWIAFTLLLIIALAVFRRLVRVPGLLLIHLGCVFTLAGFMWGSESGHKLQKKLFGIDKITTGQMKIHEGHSDNRVILENALVQELPFHIKLKDFRIEYYKPGSILIYMPNGTTRRIPAETGSEHNLGPELGKVKIVRTFERFRLNIEDNRREAIDAPDGEPMPALEVIIERPDGSQLKRYVFEPSRGYMYSKDNFQLNYQRMVSDYISDLEVIKGGHVATTKSIEVNHPLSFGGYHLYQHSYDAEAGQYTVLMVVSNTGLAVVYGGYWMLCIGVIWHLWLRHIVSKIKLKKQINGN